MSVCVSVCVCVSIDELGDGERESSGDGPMDGLEWMWMGRSEQGLRARRRASRVGSHLVLEFPVEETVDDHRLQQRDDQHDQLHQVCSAACREDVRLQSTAAALGLSMPILLLHSKAPRHTASCGRGFHGRALVREIRRRLSRACACCCISEKGRRRGRMY